MVKGSVVSGVLVAGLFSLILLGCAQKTDDTGRMFTRSITAAISDTTLCNAPQNLSSDHVYGYRGDAIFMEPSIQTGGYDNMDIREIGVNLFAPTEEGLKDTFYLLTGVGFGWTGYVYYIPAIYGAEQYTSIDQLGVINVLDLKLVDDGNGNQQVKDIEFTFNNVTLQNGYGDQICVKECHMIAKGLNDLE